MGLLNEFINYLKEAGSPSKSTLKNYKADIRQFIAWFQERLHQDFEAEVVSLETINLYKQEKTTLLSARTMERHLSSLRKFFVFLKLEGYLSHSPFESEVRSQKSEVDVYRLKDFKNYLYVYNASGLTIKNYIIDVRQFLSWAEEVTASNAAWIVEEKNVFPKLSNSLIEEYKQRLIADFSFATVNRKLSSLRKYLIWAAEEGLIHQEIGISNLIKVKTEEEKIPDAEALRAFAKQQIQDHQSSIINHQSFSRFPPVRLAQKISKAVDYAFESSIISPLTEATKKVYRLGWRMRGKPIFKKISEHSEYSAGQRVGLSENQRVRQTDFLSKHPSFPKFPSNVSKAFYAPLRTSIKYLPWYKKAYFHLRYTRPNWYKRYHSYSITTYFHLSILMIIMAALGFAFYTNFIAKPSEKPTLAVAGSPAQPLRIFSFQGRLTDINDNPITSATYLRFTLYDDLTATDPAHRIWEELRQITPDTDGIFAVLLGGNGSGGNAALCNSGNPVLTPATGACGISQAIIATQSALWLGVTVANTPELTPRQQLATVAYATNAETLQGMAPITQVGAGTTNVVLALDSSGNLTIGGSATPTFQASGGQFTISGQTLLLNTVAGSNSNIVLNPDGLGTVDLEKPLKNLSNSNNIATARGAVEVDDLFAVLATSSGQSAVTINQTGGGPLISASASGTQKFTVDNSGNVTSGNLLSLGTSTYDIGSNSNYWNNLYVNNIVGTGSLGYWQRNLGAVIPTNITDDLLLGSTATASALFSVTGIASNQPIASLSGNLIVMPRNGWGGFVGIGTTNPGSLLSLGAATGETAGGGKYKLSIYDGTGNTKLGFGYDIFDSINRQLSIVGTQAAVGDDTGRIVFGFRRESDSSFGSGLMTIKSGGNVGIGTTSPLAKLDIAGSASLSANLSLRGAATAHTFNILDDGTLNIQRSPGGDAGLATALFIQNNGNVGIGTTGPVVNLHVYKTTTGGSGINSMLALDPYTATNGDGSSIDFYTSQQGASYGSRIAGVREASGALSSLRFYTQQTGGRLEVVRLDQNGNVGIGTTGPDQLLDVLGKAGAIQLRLSSTDGSVYSDIKTDQIGDLTITPSGGDATVSGTLNITGAFAAGGIATKAYNAISDSGTATYAASDDDLYIEDILEVGSKLYVAGTEIVPATITNYWQRILGTVAPANITDDLIMGGVASSSAKFAVLNMIGSGTPTASVSATATGTGLSLGGDGTIQSLRNNTLNIGGNTTGDIALMPRNGSGYVGIGTTGPGSLLDVSTGSVAAGAISLTAGIGASSGGGAYFTANGYQEAWFNLKANLNTSGQRFMRFGTMGNGATANMFAIQNLNDAGSSITATPFRMANNAPDGTFTINSTGNVGIGTTNPLTALEVVGSASLSANLSLRGAVTAHTFNILDNGTLNIQRSPGGDAGLATALFIQNNGNVGIGTTGPGAKLHVSGGQARFPDGSVIAGNNPGIAFDSYTDTGFAANSQNLGFWESGTLALNIADVLKEYRVPADYKYTWSSATNNNSASDTSLYRNAAGVIRTGGSLIIDGNVGIGTVGPDQKLDVLSGGGGTQLRLTSTDGSVYSDLKTDQMGYLSFAPSGLIATFAATLNPNATSTYDLGSSTRVWNNLYVNNIVGTGSLGYWQRNLGALAPSNITDDLLLGSTATASALFSVSGIASNQPIASVSGNLIVMARNGWGGNVGIGNPNPAYKLDIIGDQSLSGSLFGYNINPSTTVSNYFGPQMPSSWTTSAGSYTNNNYAAPDNSSTATTMTFTAGDGIHWDLYKNFTGLTSGAIYTVSMWIKLGTATNFAMVVNDTTAWNTIGGKVYNFADGVSSSSWRQINYTFTEPAGKTGMNLHLGANQETALNGTPQTAGTVYVWGLQIRQITPNVLTINGNTIINGYATASASLNVGYSGVLGGTGNAAFSGKVGIGTTSPLTALEVVGSASLSANLSLRGAVTAHTFNILDNGTLNIQRSPGGDAGLATALFIQNNGNVGIGTTGPLEKLDVNGNATISGNLVLASAVGTSRNFQATANNTLNIGGNTTGNISLMPRNGVGFVGINMTNPASELDVTGDVLIRGNDGFDGSGDLAVLNFGNTKNAGIIASYANPAGIIFANWDSVTSGTLGANSRDVMFLEEDTGFVGIGTNAPLSILNIKHATSPTFTLERNDTTVTAGENLGLIDFYSRDSSTSLAGVVGRIKVAASTDFSSGSSPAGANSYMSFHTNTGNAGTLTEAMRINYNGGVGIGTTNPLSKLDVQGQVAGKALVNLNYTGGDQNILTASTSGATKFYLTNTGVLYGSSFYDIDNSSYFLDSAATGTSLTTVGGVGIGTTNPLASSALDIQKATSANAMVVLNQLDTVGTVGDFITASASGVTQFRVKSNGDVVVGPSGNGKLTALTLDPLYTIDGVRYSTYGTSMVGVKEEVAGKAELVYDPTEQAYAYKIELNNQEQGSDLWLFSRVIDPNVSLTSVLLTPESSANIWYRKDVENRTITLLSDSPTSVSYRFTAPRFDHGNWGNLSDETEISGLIVPGMNELMSNQLSSTNSASQGVTLQPQFSIAQTIDEFGNTIYSLVDDFGNSIKRTGSFSNLIVANIEAGMANISEITVSSLNLTTENLTIGGLTLRNYIASIVNDVISNSQFPIFNQFSSLNSQNIISPSAEVDHLATNIISPLSSDSQIALRLQNTKLEILNFNNATGSAVAEFDNAGNATFSGKVRSQELAVSSDASVAGTLRAKKIIADEIEGLNIATPSATIVNNYLDIASYSGQLAYIENFSSDFLQVNQGLMVFGPTSLSDVSIVGQLAIGGQMILTENGINVLGTDLELQPLRQGGISFLSGLFRIDNQGNIVAQGQALFEKNVAVKGKLAAGIISPLAQDSNLSVSLGGNSKFEILNSSGSATMAMTAAGDLIASGAATFNKLNLSLASPAYALSETMEIATGSAGISSIKPYQNEITIENSLVTDKSLIYITPRSNTGPNGLYLMRQTPEDATTGIKGSFTVGINQYQIIEIPFNWMIIN